MSIDSLYEGMIAKLTNQSKILDISKHLISLKTNEERVLFVFDLIEENKSFPKIPEVTKSKNVSIHYRNHGNQCFQKSEDYKAWQYYNLALLHSPPNSELSVLSLANRSAVFLSMKKYKECLKDIQIIFSMKYPGRLKDKLLKRKIQCETAISETNEDEFDKEKELLELKDSTDPRYPCASSKLQVVFSKEMGRHVVAKEDIKAGEVLVQEDPYFVLLLKMQYLFSCNYCLSRELNLLPCDKCCFALYCSEECKEKAWKEYHEIECRLMPMLLRMDFTKLELLALRTVIKARTDHADWSALFKTIDEAEANKDSEYCGHVKIDDKWIFDSKYYASIHTLATNVEKRSMSDIFQKSVTAAVFLKALMDKSDFLKSDNDEEKENIKRCVAGLLLHHGMTSPTNMHGISCNIATKAGHYVNEVSLASATYAFHSLLNHSCSPNAVRENSLGLGRMRLFALRPIKKGQQIFDNYGPHHALEDRLSRAAALKFQYKFNCLCEACSDNWPTYLEMQWRRNTDIPISIQVQKNKLLGGDTIEKLQRGDKEFAYELFKPLCQLLEELEPYGPCVELADCQESMKQCLSIFGGLVPYGYSQLVEWKAIPPKV